MAGADTSHDDDLLAEAQEAFSGATDAWADNYNEALDDFRFGRLHEHWPEDIIKERQGEGRPCLTIPRLPAFIRQVVNDARQNTPGVIVSPVDSAADPETAEIINGLIRQIERSSHADVAYDTALEHAVTGGFGWWKINTRYSRDDSFEQDLVIEPVPNAFSILPDPDSTAADSSDWNVAFEIEQLTRKAFERRFKGAEPVSFDGRGSERKPVGPGELVQIAYHWSREETRRKIVAVSPIRSDAPPELVAAGAGMLGESLILGLEVYERNRDLFDALGVIIMGSHREVPSYKVTQRILSGCDVLEDNPWAGKFIPIIPVYGEDINIEGKRYLSGLIRPAKDEQRRYNYELSAATEASGLAPKSPFIGPVGAFDTDRAKWETANVKNHPFIEYDTTGPEGQTINPPQRQGYGGIPAAQLQLALSASDNLKAIMGLHDASLGARSNETSGRAIMARQREGDVSSFHFIDNLSRAIRHGGEVLLDLIPRVYSTPRIVKVLGPDKKTARSVPVNQPTTVEVPQEGGRLAAMQKIYDLTAGKYDLTVKAGPSYTTQREEFVALCTEIIRAMPAAAPVLADLIIKNYDMPDADEVVKRLEALLPPQLQGQNPEVEAMRAQIQQLGQMLGQARAELQGAKMDRDLEARKLEIDAYGAETNRMKAVAPKGVPYDPAQMGALVAQSLVAIMQSPDILEMAASGAPQEQLMAAMAQRMAPPTDPAAGPPAMAA